MENNNKDVLILCNSSKNLYEWFFGSFYGPVGWASKGMPICICEVFDSNESEEEKF